MATASLLKLPDGKEANAVDVICEGCDKPLSEHTCANGGAAGGSATATVSRSTGPRKDPTSRPLCPHCNGAIHFSMPGGLQNVECIMRQYYVDTGVIVDPFARLPIFGLSEIGKAIEWSTTLKSPLTYGRMDSAAGGAGTYAAIRPKADPATKGTRAKKQQAAAPGERIEDVAATAAAAPPAATSEAPAAAPAAAGTVDRAARRARLQRGTTATEAAPAAPVEAPVEAAPEMTREERREARRQALLNRAS